VAVPDNEGFDLLEIRAILQRLEELGVSSEIVDMRTKSDEDRENLYLEATLPTAHKKYRVRQVFGSKRHAGYLFGRGVPALLVSSAKNRAHRRSRGGADPGRETEVVPTRWRLTL